MKHNQEYAFLSTAHFRAFPVSTSFFRISELKKMDMRPTATRCHDYATMAQNYVAMADKPAYSGHALWLRKAGREVSWQVLTIRVQTLHAVCTWTTWSSAAARSFRIFQLQSAEFQSNLMRKSGKSQEWRRWLAVCWRCEVSPWHIPGPSVTVSCWVWRASEG